MALDADDKEITSSNEGDFLDWAQEVLTKTAIEIIRTILFIILFLIGYNVFVYGLLRVLSN